MVPLRSAVFKTLALPNELCYIVAEKAKVAELVDALDSKSSPAHPGCRFESDLWYWKVIGRGSR